MHDIKRREGCCRDNKNAMRDISGIENGPKWASEFMYMLHFINTTMLGEVVFKVNFFICFISAEKPLATITMWHNY